MPRTEVASAYRFPGKHVDVKEEARYYPQSGTSATNGTLFPTGQNHVDGETVRSYGNGALAQVKGNSRSRYVTAAIQRDRSK